MTLRRFASAALAGTALVGLPLVTGGMASANESHHQPAPEGQGSLVYAPVYAPVQPNTCGNTINTVGLLNPAFGNTCANQNGDKNKLETGSTTGPENPAEVPGLPVGL